MPRDKGLWQESVHVRLTQQHREKLDRLAEASGRPPSGVMRRLLELATVERPPQIYLDPCPPSGESLEVTS